MIDRCEILHRHYYPCPLCTFDQRMREFDAMTEALGIAKMNADFHARKELGEKALKGSKALKNETTKH